MSNEKKSNTFEHALGFCGLLLGISVATEDPELNIIITMILGYAGGYLTGSIIKVLFSIVIQVIAFGLSILILLARFNNILNLFGQ